MEPVGAIIVGPGRVPDGLPTSSPTLTGLGSGVNWWTASWSAQPVPSPFEVEICHINGVAGFPDTATIDEINSPSNLIALCPNCHWEFDNGLISREMLEARDGIEPSTASL